MSYLKRLRKLGEHLDKTLCLIPDTRFTNGNIQKGWVVMDWHADWMNEDVFEKPMGIGLTAKAAVSNAISNNNKTPPQEQP